jgi:anti-repressor protein
MEQIFKHNDAQLRTSYDESGQIWFSGVDVCNALGYVKASIIIDRLDDDEKKLEYMTDTSGQRRRGWSINESGLYSLVLTSTKPEAKVFKKWITFEVIPSIRKAGFYATDSVSFKLTELQEHKKRIQQKQIELFKAKEVVKQVKAEIEELDSYFWDVFNTDANQLKLFSSEEMQSTKKLKEVTNG